MDTLETQPFVLCREFVFFWRLFIIATKVLLYTLQLGDLNFRSLHCQKCFHDTIMLCPADQHYITQENPAYARTGSLGPAREVEVAREVESGENESEDYTYVCVHHH